MSKTMNYADIPAEMFTFARTTDHISDKKLETKPVGYFKDAFYRFRKNKSSTAAAIIILLLVLFSIFAPLMTPYTIGYIDMNMKGMLPKSRFFSQFGFWDGAKRETISEATYWSYRAMGEEMGLDPIKELYGVKEEVTYIGTLKKVTRLYTVRLDSYTKDGAVYKLLSAEEYAALQRYQDEKGVQIIYPAVPEKAGGSFDQYNANGWYVIGQNKLPKGYDAATGSVTWENQYIAYTGDDGYTSAMRIEGDTPQYDYAIRKQGNQYYVRVNYYRYYEYINGFEACFLFGSNQDGRDIFVRLAYGARFSLLLAVSVSLINLVLGAIYGAIEGYYGGAADMIMERVVEILSGVPFIVIVTLFKLHLASKVGVVACLLFAFVTTGWIGTASLVRTQFYRYKHQEYVLAARTLGASDFRLIFKHIFPNALGTMITSCVLVIPGVIFSESSLSYLNIVNLEGSTATSIGTMLSNGSGATLQAYPHIIFFPALFISLLEISFNLFGNGLRDAFNPSLRGVDE